jgi:hypothetical protein
VASACCGTGALVFVGAWFYLVWARIEAPALYKGFGPAVVELAWLAKFKLNVWAAAPFRCSPRVRNRTVAVDLLFPKMLPSASLSEGVVFVSLFPAGYQVWDVAH